MSEEAGPSHARNRPTKVRGTRPTALISAPAGQEYADYHKPAKLYIESHLPNWETEHYMLPVIFKYKSALPSGSASGAVKGVGPDCEDRSMDIVYHAVDAFMRKKNVPGVVFREFTMMRKKKLLFRFFPFRTEKGWERAYEDVECDLLIVSPKLGLVAIEVKGTEAKGHSAEEALRDGVYQQPSARCMRQFLDFLLKHDKDVPVRRIVALPFQERVKLQDTTLPGEGQEKKVLDEKVGKGKEVDACLFFEDFGETNSGLYSCLQEFLPVDTPGWFRNDAFAELMQTLITIWALRQTGADVKGHDLDPSQASVSLAYEQEDEGIRQQDFAKKKPAEKLNAKNRNKTAKKKSGEPESAIIESAADSVMMTDPVNCILYMTPEQQKVLDGPRIQLIHGPAGSGKSVLIMIKAAQLIGEGQRVTICASWIMVDNYKLWKERNGFTDEQCEVYEIGEIGTLLESLKRAKETFEEAKKSIAALAKELGKSSVLSPSESCLAEVKRIISELHKPAQNGGSSSSKTPFSGRSVFVDDASYTGGYDRYALLYLAFDNTHDHHLWIAADALQCGAIASVSVSWRMFSTAVSLAAAVLGELPSEEAGTLSVLRSVQRCSTHVFNAWLHRCNDRMAQDEDWAYAKELYRGVVPGHHFVGPVVNCLLEQEVEDALKFVSDEVAKLIRGGTRPSHIAILCESGLGAYLIQASLVKENTSVACCAIKDQLNGTEAVAVGYCGEAVSLEWPIVFVVCPSSTYWPGDLPLAMSRARTKLTVVKVAQW